MKNRRRQCLRLVGTSLVGLVGNEDNLLATTFEIIHTLLNLLCGEK